MFDSTILNRTDPLAAPKTIIHAIAPELRNTANHEYVISQAQRRLKERSWDELQAGSTYLEELFQAAGQLAQEHAISELAGGSDFERVTDPTAFVALFEEYDLDQKAQFPDAKPVEYFALLALIYAMESLEYLKHYDDPKDREHAAMTSIVIERGKEVIAFIHGMEFEGIFRRKISASGNQSRHARHRALKDKVLRFADEHCSKRSNRESARRALGEFEHEVKEVLSTDDPKQRLAKWIGEHRRNQLGEQA